MDIPDHFVPDVCMMSPNPDASMMLDDVDMVAVSPSPQKSAKKAKKQKDDKKKRKRKSSETALDNDDGGASEAAADKGEDEEAEETKSKSGKKAKLNLPKMSKEVRERLKAEDDFIGDILSMMYVPKHKKTRFGQTDDGEGGSDDEDVTLGEKY